MANDVPFDYSGTELAALSAAVNYYEWILSRFERYLGKSIAEVGAGIGSFSKLLLRTSPQQLFAFEPSTNLFPQLIEGVGRDQRVVPINDYFAPSYVPEGVDSVVYINVLEHVEHDLAELENGTRSLAAGRALNCLQPCPFLVIQRVRQTG